MIARNSAEQPPEGPASHQAGSMRTVLDPSIITFTAMNIIMYKL